MKTVSQYSSVSILDIPFTCCAFDEMLLEISRGITSRSRNVISITNTESLYHAIRLPSHARYIQSAMFSCCDGIGVVMAGKLLGVSIPRLHGPDLMLNACEYGADKKWRHYFYGGKPGVADLLSTKLSEKFPGLITAGTFSPPFRPSVAEESPVIIEQINDSRPDILWVGLGLLKQEKWISLHRDKLDVPWMIGVGAAFDFYSGMIKRAPGIFRHMGLEWLYRLTFEPRMFKRNMYSMFVIGRVAMEMAGSRYSFRLRRRAAGSRSRES